MKDLEKIFYGNIVAYDSAILPVAKQDELSNVIWRLDSFALGSAIAYLSIYYNSVESVDCNFLHLFRSWNDTDVFFLLNKKIENIYDLVLQNL